MNLLKSLNVNLKNYFYKIKFYFNFNLIIAHIINLYKL